MKRALLNEIEALMVAEGLSRRFILDAVQTATSFEGVYDLLEMWAHETDITEKNETLKVIAECVADCNRGK